MRVSLLQLCIAFAAVCFAFGEETAETQQRTSFFKKLVSPVTSVYSKSKRGLGSVKKMLTPSRKGAIKDEGETAKSPLAEGLGAVMDALDEAAEDGKATADVAATETKDAADKSSASAEEAVAASKDTLSAAAGDAEETGTASLENAEENVDAVGEGIEELSQQATDSATEAQGNVEEGAEVAADEVKTASGSGSEEL